MSKEDLLVFVGKTGPHIPSSSWAAHNTGETSGGRLLSCDSTVQNSPSQRGEVHNRSTNPSRAAVIVCLSRFPRQRLRRLSITQSHRKIFQKFLWGIQKIPGIKKKRNTWLSSSVSRWKHEKTFLQGFSHTFVSVSRFTVQFRRNQPKKIKNKSTWGKISAQDWSAGRGRLSLLGGNLWSYEMTQIYINIWTLTTTTAFIP